MNEATAQFDLLYSAIKQHDVDDEKYAQSPHHYTHSRAACSLPLASCSR